MTRSFLDTRRLLDVFAVSALCVLAAAPLAAAFISADFWIAVLAGAAIGASIAALGAARRWRALSIAALVVIAYFLFGTVVAFRDHAILGMIPTLDILTSLALSVVRVWMQMLTLPAPFTGFDHLAIGPFLATLVVTVVAVSLALRVRYFATALIPVAVLAAGAIAFSTYQGYFPAAVGAALFVLAALWATWRAQRARRAGNANLAVDAQSGSVRPRLSAGLVAFGIVAVAATGGVAGAAAVAGDREVLRDRVVPPLELHAYASPLTNFRKWVSAGEDLELFTVSGLPAGTPIRLATLDFYDGIVYKVSGSGGAGAGIFARVGREIPNHTEGHRARMDIEISGLDGVWMPTAGYLDGVALGEGLNADALHYNSATGTAILTSGLSSDRGYSLEVTLPPPVDEVLLARAKVAGISTPLPERIPDALLGALDQVVPAEAQALEQLRTLEAWFQEGYFSSGLEGQSPSRSGHSVGRQAELLSGQMVGDDEQYAVAMALAVSQLGIPVRVVTGFVPESAGETVSVTGADAHAWVEVPFEGIGWVSFFPTPSEDNVMTDEAPEPRQQPRVQVAQPPEQPEEPAELPPAPPVEESAERDEPEQPSWIWTAVRIAASVLALLAVLLGPSLLLVILRGRRRKHRRRASSTVAKVDGGWAELLDAAEDVGEAPLRGATRREQSVTLEQRVPQVASLALAHRADAAVFGEGAPSPEAAEQYWVDMESARKLLARAVPWRRRVLGRMFPRSVLRAPQADATARTRRGRRRR